MYFLMILLTIALCFDYGLASNILEIIKTNKGQFTSPGYPGDYPNNVNYTWVIKTGDVAANVTFEIHFMDIRKGNPCDDYLQIKEVEPCYFNVFNRCGELKEMTVFTRGKQIRVSFISDETLNAKGFNLSWTVTLPPPPQPKITRMSTTTPSKTSVRIYPSKRKIRLITAPTTTASTGKMLTTISITTTTLLTTTPTTTVFSTTTTEMKTRTKLKSTSTRKLTNTPATNKSSTALQMTTSSMRAKKTTYVMINTRPNLLTTYLAATFKSRSSKLSERTQLTTNVRSNVTTTQALTSIPIIDETSTLGITFKYDATKVTFLESPSGYMIIGTCVFEAILVIIGVIVVKRFRSRVSKEIPRQGVAVTGGLMESSTETGAHNVYESIPIEHFISSDVKEIDKGLYVQYPDNVYDSSLIRRPHALQNNAYETNEGIYNVSFSKRDHDILIGSNSYESCELTTFLRIEEKCERKF